MADLNDTMLVESLKYLLVSEEEKVQMETKDFDENKQCWIPDTKLCYIGATIEKDCSNESHVTVLTDNNEIAEVKRHEVLKMNSPRFEKLEDNALLPFLNDATVLHNLKERYLSYLIYTYSGLFCVVINPYRALPIYTMRVMNYYRGKSKVEVPPHLYLVADSAFCCMLRNRENQSMIITGESGAGKTENAKKAIQYFARIATRVTSFKEDLYGSKNANLEDQITSANPVLEAYGNAKTSRNNNSSRFGKFIRIHFGLGGNISGADIESYLLEKSRVTFQHPSERNFHIFYQLLSSACPEFQYQFLVKPDPSQYFYISQGMLTIDNVDDSEEMAKTNQAFDILNFKSEEKMNLFKCTCAIMHFGNIKWKQRPREEQAEIDGTEECENISYLLGIQSVDLLKSLMKPKIRVGTDYVNKGQNREQVVNATSSLCKSIYSRCFSWLIDRVNETLDSEKIKRQHFIGVLDIAGFEIFQINSFEQLCINFTNEKLQQFFNYHMFVLEQEEYQKEEILWEMIDFRLNLNTCIDLIEKPMGIFSILEEECIVPKACDKTFKEKLYRNHFGKDPHFAKTKPVKGREEAHFDIHHYAGTVSYNVTGWLEKNKDAKNPTVFALFKNSSNPLLSLLYQDNGEEDKVGKIKKKTSVQTISYCHRRQLKKLMANLKSTNPHFVRCILPNEIKQHGLFDSHLVLHQLHCNNILEGIRICRKGFPVRITFQEFQQRYSFLLSKKTTRKLMKEKSLDENDNGLRRTEAILKRAHIEDDQYRFGTTKIFFRTDILKVLEDLKDNHVAKFITMFQAHIRKYLVLQEFRLAKQKHLAIRLFQHNFKKYVSLKKWSWWILHTMITNKSQTPSLNITNYALIQDSQPCQNDHPTLEADNHKPDHTLSDCLQAFCSAYEDSLPKEFQCGKCKLKQSTYKDFYIEELARAKEKFEDLMIRKEAETKRIYNRLEAEINNGVSLKKKLIDLNQELFDAKLDTETELNLKEKAYNQISSLKKRNEELFTKLDEAEGSKDELSEIIRKKDTEIVNLKENLDIISSHNDMTVAKLKKKHQDSINDINEQMDQVLRANTKHESEKASLRHQLDEAVIFNTSLTKGKEASEKTIKSLNQKLTDVNQKHEDLQSVMIESKLHNTKLLSEKQEQSCRIETLNSKNSELASSKSTLQTQIKKLKVNYEDQAKKLFIQTQELKKINSDLNAAKNELSEEHALKVELQTQVTKANIELGHLKSQVETQGLVKCDEIDEVKRKMTLKLTQANEKYEEMLSKCTSLEMIKHRLQSEIEDLLLDVEKANKNAITMDRKQKQFEKLINEWKQKCEDFSKDLEVSQKESRQFACDLTKMRSQNAEVDKIIETLREENANLANVIKDLMSQLDISNKKCHEFEKTNKKLELEAEQLKSHMKDTNSLLDIDDNKISIVNLEMEKLRQKIDSLLQDKEEEFENLRQTQQRALLSIQASLEIEIKSKQDAIKQKKKLEIELDAAQSSISNLYKIDNDQQLKNKRLQQKIYELESQIDDERTKSLEAKETILNAQRRSCSLITEIDEKTEALEKNEKSRRSMENDLTNTNDRISELLLSNSTLATQKRKIEQENNQIRSELEDSLDELKNSESKLKKACEDAGRLAEELRLEQEYAMDLEKSKTHLEQQLKDYQLKLTDIEATTVKGGKRLIEKLEKRIADLEAELTSEKKRYHEASKEMKKTERSLKEVVQQSAEEKKKRENLQEQLEKLQMKMKSYRKQIEETEEMAAQNLSKFRRIQQRLQDGSADDLRYLSSPRGKSEQRGFYGERSPSDWTCRL